MRETHTFAPSRHPYEPVTVVSELDGSTVTVGSQPGVDGGGPVVVLRLRSPLLDLVNTVYLLPSEAREVADELDAAASLPPGPRRGPAAWVEEESAGLGATGTVAVRHTVTATERTTVADLRDALALVPPSSRLSDFAADDAMVLVFGALAA